MPEAAKKVNLKPTTMGKYINQDSKGNQLPACGKLELLLKDGAVNTDETYKENMICVVDNGLFDAVAYMYSEAEYEYFKGLSGKFFVYPHASELAQ